MNVKGTSVFCSRDIETMSPSEPASGALCIQRVFDPLRERGTDTRDAGEIGGHRLAHPAHRSELPEQGALLRGTDAGDVVEQRADRALAAHVLVVRDREAVRLVADPLDEIEAL